MLRFLLLAFALLIAWPAFADGVRIVVPAHEIARGSTIAASDLAYATVNGTILSGTVTAMNDLVGMQARRTLQAGMGVRSEDVRRPILVTKGSTVTMMFEAPGISLTAMGRAMTEGGMGETVTIQNTTSYRQISAIVMGPGTVRAVGMTASIPARVAQAEP